ncbi:MAG: radical SAM protein [Deltaproteobacteria bacterium]|jgi:pyruvate-formate lyase-activating enzyme|nr:radical SAM protein [Deltaproteobacteria bacterium]MBW2515235.1 radical SAM protein [Deltaproteobacteria bacterium]
METAKCRLKEQGFSAGSCAVEADGKRRLACQATLKYKNGDIYRLITSVHLSRPENYLSVYQSGCNFSCRKCHSWTFSKIKDGQWYSPGDILDAALAYEKNVTQFEPRSRATAWHAHDACRCCGSCVTRQKPSAFCPGVLEPEQIVLSPQGFGPARNIVAFTGGDVTCCPEFYGECARLLKDRTRLWVLIETNGYGLTPRNLDDLKDSGVDAFWLDIKAFDAENHRWLTGCDNDRILKLPQEIIQRGFVLEVLSLFIPGLVETADLESIARILVAVDHNIPFTILAFFPEYKMKDFASPTVAQMVNAYQRVKALGLTNVRLGNVGVFARSAEDQAYLMENVDPDAY